FVVNDDQRRATLDANTSSGSANQRRPREQLLVHHDGDEVSLGLYLDASALANLERHDPRGGLSDHNFGDFCLAVEGVSHFIYVAHCAAANRQVSALELELQAEVDKFVSCVLVDQHVASRPHELRVRLYENVRYANDLDADEHDRYTTANRHARNYASALARRYLEHANVPEMLSELRRFYRLPLDAKLGHIAKSAAS
ncbi:MAG TPA: hypothetical protein VGG33_04140, partial [Polyangia bacterium]